MLRRIGRICVFFLLVAGHAGAQVTGPAGDQKSIRVGVISYADPKEKVAEVNRIVSAEKDLPRAEYAIGTYADVLEWIAQGLVDVAKLSPGAFAETTASGNTDKYAIPCRYLATEGKPPWSDTDWTHIPGDLSALHPRYFYNSICLVRSDSGIATWEDLVKKSQAHELQFIFTDPLSVSGALLPMKVLREKGIDYRTDMEYSWGHRDSFELLRRPHLLFRDGKLKIPIIFTFSSSLKPSEIAVASEKAPLAQISIPLTKNAKLYGKAAKLEEVEIPEEVWVTREGYPDEDFEHLRRILFAHTEKRQGGDPADSGLKTFSNEMANSSAGFSRIRKWGGNVHEYLGENSHRSRTELFAASSDIPSTLRDIYGLMLKYDRTRQDASEKPLRIALVFSGGGAKCAYQAGAATAIEKELDRFRQEDAKSGGSQHLPDIGVVVGTSGGALNALPVALNLASTKPGQPSLNDTWRELDIRKMVRPKAHVRFILGLLLAYLMLLFMRLFAMRTIRRGPGNSQITTSTAVVIILAAVALYVIPNYLPPEIVTLGCSHFLFYAVYILSISSRWAALFLLTSAVLIALEIHFSRHTRATSMLSPVRLAQSINKFFRNLEPHHLKLYEARLALLFFLLLGTAIAGALLSRNALFDGDPLVDTIAEKYRKLFNHKLQTGDGNPGRTEDQLRSLSAQIVEHADSHRDLVITGSFLGKIAGDKYFYWPKDSESSNNPFPGRGIRITHQDHDQLLLDVTIGSGTIYPMFPPRQLKGLIAKHLETPIDLIDGGFSHNSPIEAAVLWGATHVIVIEADSASPQKGVRQASFLSNALDAFNYLYDQAQISDVRARATVAVFTLRPAKGSTLLLDFGLNFADRAITLGESDVTSRRFTRQVAAPHFARVEEHQSKD